MDAPTIRFMDCETCGRRTQHFRTSSPILKVTFPYSVYRLDYPTLRYMCMECGEVKEALSENGVPTGFENQLR